MLVFADEFRLETSRLAGPDGRYVVQVKNIGEDDHDLRIRRTGGATVASSRLVRPGRITELRTRLAPGRYTLFCSVTDHEALGMRAPLTVRRRGSR